MWYVMQVYTGAETDICEKCRERILEEGEDIFVPLAERMTKVRGERVLATSRLFPGYLFVETDRIEDFHMRLKDIQARWPPSIHPEEEERIRMLCGDRHIARYSEGYIEGDTLIVTQGALKDFHGKVKKILRHKRLVVMELLLLGRSVEVTLGLGVVSRQGTEEIRKIRAAGA